MAKKMYNECFIKQWKYIHTHIYTLQSVVNRRFFFVLSALLIVSFVFLYLNNLTCMHIYFVYRWIYSSHWRCLVVYFQIDRNSVFLIDQIFGVKRENAYICIDDLPKSVRSFNMKKKIRSIKQNKKKNDSFRFFFPSKSK